MQVQNLEGGATTDGRMNGGDFIVREIKQLQLLKKSDGSIAKRHMVRLQKVTCFRCEQLRHMVCLRAAAAAYLRKLLESERDALDPVVVGVPGHVIETCAGWVTNEVGKGAAYSDFKRMQPPIDSGSKVRRFFVTLSRSRR